MKDDKKPPNLRLVGLSCLRCKHSSQVKQFRKDNKVCLCQLHDNYPVFSDCVCDDYE